MDKQLVLIPLKLKEANAFVLNFHRHNKPVTGHRFCIGVSDAALGLVAVAIVGRPIARRLDDGFTAEVLRVCSRPDAPTNCCSMLYAACWRAWRAMGGKRLVTYILKSENGTSVKAAGWKVVAEVPVLKKGWQTRNREWQPIYGQQKLRFEVSDES